MKPRPAWRTAVRKTVFAAVQASFLASTMLASPLAIAPAVAANPSADLDQCANDPAPSPHTNGCASSATEWVNGNLGESKSVYLEGDSIAYRMRFDNLDTSISHTVIIEWDTTKAGKHAIDFLTTWNRTVADSNPCLGVSGCTLGSPSSTFAIPKDPQVDNGSGSPIHQLAGNFTMWGATVTGVSAYSYPDGSGFAGDKSAQIAITFDASVANPVLAWGGHIADRHDWGEGNAAISIPGSPYHMRLIDLDGAGGNQDRSLSAAAVIFPGSITIIKDASPNGSTSFSFTAAPSPLGNFNLVDDGTSANTKVFSGITSFQTYTVSESVPSGWDFTGYDCDVTSANGGSTADNGASGVDIDLKEGENWTCTFSNSVTPAPALSITKEATESGFDSVGDVIHYTIVATNTGNVTLGSVTVTDPNAANLDCTPANGSALDPGESMTCTASHTVTQADLDAGHYFNQACVDDGQGGATEACDDVDTPGDQNPHLSIDKVDDTGTFDSVGDVIHYTITATNDGNVTLAAVTVTDPNANNLDCSPANGSSLAPGESMECTASHTVTQDDLDAGHYANEACVDDGQGGAAAACDDVDTPGDQNPHLSIDKVDNTGGFDSVGDVISYSITATNDGNVTLHDVVVTDPNASGLDCSPALPVADLAPGDSITCTASHTIVQGDVDLGYFYNQACVDDGDGGADEACDDVTTPGSKNPHLTIDKNATEQGFDSVGDVIHYSITATNDGNVTLHDVDVSDPNVSDLDCSPATPVADLAPGESITCTASHTITQADLDEGSFFNEACVDDGEAGAAEACDDVDTPGDQNAALSIDKNATEQGFDSVGDVIHYSITATNTGNVTLHGVDVSDPNVSDLDCSPATPVQDLAPGESITCTASHTITQADLDEGSFFNQACVDDTEGPAPEACDDVDTPGENGPALAIDKTVAEAGFTEVGQVLHYTIVATNIGNVTLHDVVVTDPNASNLECDPSLPVPNLAPGESITCSADHTVTAEDLANRFFDNEACVDDGEGGADEACDQVHSPGQEVQETTEPSLPNTATGVGNSPSSPSNLVWVLMLVLGVLTTLSLAIAPRPRRQRRE